MRMTALIMVGLAAISFSCTKAPVDEYAMITFMIGQVQKNDTSAGIGDILKEKDVVQTGAESFCDIKIGDSLIRVKQKSKIVLSSLLKKGLLENTTIDMDSGRMLCKPKKLIKSESFLIKTPTAVAGVRGTQFSVEADANGTSRIKVFEGTVRVAKRVKQLDDQIEKVLSLAPDVQKEEKVVITKQDAEIAEKKVETAIKTESSKGRDAAIEAAITKTEKDVAVGRKNIERFAVKDFQRDNREIIEVRKRPVEVVREISRAIEQEKEEPKPNGRLLVTRFEVYFIKNGTVKWEGPVVQEPVKTGDKLYIASGEYVFCASIDGPVIWRKEMANEGKLEIRDNALVVSAGGTKTMLNLKTGRKL